jgi:uncharacterized protein YbjT (DUF2867 family)
VNSQTNDVLVVGAYGLIGYGISKRLISEGYSVTGLGRNMQVARRVLPDIPWIEHDIRTLCEEAQWRQIIREFSTVVNCSGALQDGPEDDLEAIHHDVVAALAAACCSENVALIQISAVGANPQATTSFLASKGRGDAAIRAAGGKWHILRPGLVLASNAYGGTTMLRMLAAFPWIQPISTPDAKIQTVSLDDVASTVVAATEGQIPNGLDLDLVEPEAYSLREILSQMRQWLGFSPAICEIALPNFCVFAVAKLADALSWLGWRSPLRTTALKVLSEGVLAKPADLRRFGMSQISTLPQTLRKMPVGAQDRLFARMALLAPVIIACLCFFWLTSGVVGIARVNEAALVLEGVGWPHGLAVTSVLFWAVVDIAIAAAFAFRKYAYSACWAAVGVSLFYLLASTITVPSLWVDPLGPLVKVVPSIILALVARAALEAR